MRDFGSPGRLPKSFSEHWSTGALEHALDDPRKTNARPKWFVGAKSRWLLLAALPFGGAALAVSSASRSVSGRPFFDMLFIAAGMNLCAYVWVRTSRSLRLGWQWAILLSIISLQAGAGALVRRDGLWGNGRPRFAWRWTPEPRELYPNATVDGQIGRTGLERGQGRSENR